MNSSYSVGNRFRVRQAVRRHSRPGRSVARVPLMAVGVAVGLAAWQAMTAAAVVPEYVLPTPLSVGHALVAGLVTSPMNPASYWEGLFSTVEATVGGFLVGSLLGVLAGIVLAQSRTIEVMTMPYVVGMQSVPKVAVAPLVLIWFGYGQTSKVALAAALAFFPVLVNSIEGLRSSDRALLDVLSCLKASRLQVLWYVRLPAALPTVFAGLNVAVVYALLGALIAELLGAQSGIGVQILRMGTSLDVAGIFAALVVLAVVGYVLNVLVRSLQRRIVFWAESTRSGDG